MYNSSNLLGLRHYERGLSTRQSIKINQRLESSVNNRLASQEIFLVWNPHVHYCCHKTRLRGCVLHKMNQCISWQPLPLTSNVYSFSLFTWVFQTAFSLQLHSNIHATPPTRLVRSAHYAASHKFLHRRDFLSLSRLNHLLSTLRHTVRRKSKYHSRIKWN